MTTIIFERRPDFELGALRESLDRHFAPLRWQCGEDDTGAPGERVRFERPLLLVGRGPEGLLMIPLTPHEEGAGLLMIPLTPHEEGAGLRIELGAPTTDDERLARHLRLAIARCLMLADRDGARCRLTPDGAWLSTEQVSERLADFAEDWASTAPEPRFALDAGTVAGFALPVAGIIDGLTGGRFASLIDTADTVMSAFERDDDEDDRRERRPRKAAQPPPSPAGEDRVDALIAKLAAANERQRAAPPRHPGGFGRKGL